MTLDLAVQVLEVSRVARVNPYGIYIHENKGNMDKGDEIEFHLFKKEYILQGRV